MKNKFFIPILCIALLTGCEKHLDLTPVSYITTNSFWTSEDDVEGALNGVYARLRNDAVLNFFIWGEARSEVMEHGTAGVLGYNRYYEQTLSRLYPGPAWNNLYSVINMCNLLIKYTPQIQFNDEKKRDNAIAQAYTMRAFVYYQLVRIWGGVPMRTEPLESYDPMTIQLPRTPKEQIFRLIKEDIDKASKLYSDNNYPDGRCKWSLPSLNALKADVYLWTGKVEGGGTSDIQVALAALEEIEQSDISLQKSYRTIFDYNNKGNKEILMAVRFFLDESGEQTFAHNMYLSSISDIPTYVPKWQVDSIGAPKPGNGSSWRITKLVRDQFTKDDNRRTATYFDLEGSGENQYFTNYGMKFNGMVEGGIRHFLDDWIIYRYADILLMKAEAKNALGQDPSEEINAIRKRAYGASYGDHVFTSGSVQENDAAILKERLLELTLEGKRWWDLIRFDQVFNLVPKLQGRENDRYMLLWPLSNDALSRETLVEQTPGYE